MDYECWPLGDSALLLKFGVKVDPLVNAAVHDAAATLSAAALPGVRAVAPSYAALVLTLDLVLLQRAGGLEELQRRIRLELANFSAVAPEVTRAVEIPVRYGAADGPDLAAVAAQVDLSMADVIELHASVEYQVAMVGFLPGFPYLLGLPERLHISRRHSIRALVPAGSVAIAGAQAGIYPGDSPGGWHLIGRTGLRLFDAANTHPAMLLPGDRVRFVPVR
jgi:KipI family sensor histidine kinase inhibitor